MLFFLPKPIRRLVALAILLGLLSVADLAVRTWAEGQVESRVDDRLQGAGSVDVSFRGFPFVGRLLLFGEVDGVNVRIDELVRNDLTFAKVGVDLQGIALDRQKLLTDRKVDLEDLDSGTAFAEITADELSGALGVPVRLSPGRAEVTVGGVTVAASVAVREGSIVVIPEQLAALSVPVPKSAFLPCASKVTVLSGRVKVTCTITTIPKPMLLVINQAS